MNAEPIPPRRDCEPAPDRRVPDAVDAETGLTRIAELRRMLHPPVPKDDE